MVRAIAVGLPAGWVREAAIAVNGCAPDLRMVFGQCIGVAARKRRHTPLGEDEEDDALVSPPR